MPATPDIIAASQDPDLIERIAATVAKLGTPAGDDPRQWAARNAMATVAAPIDGDTSLAAVHAYAVATYQPTPRPGADTAKVRDDQLEAAVAAILG